MKTYKEFILEGIRDKMTPLSNKFIDDTWKKVSTELLEHVKDWGVLDESLIIKIIEDKKDLILHMFSEGYSLDIIAHSIVFPELNDADLKTFEKIKNKKELKEEQQKKDEKRYLSERERKRLNDSQRKYLVNKRKEQGSWNDDDIHKESLVDKMTPITDEEYKEELKKLSPWERGNINTQFFKIFTPIRETTLPGCRSCNKIVDVEPTRERQMLGNAYQTLCKCKECGEFIIVDDDDFNTLEWYLKTKNNNVRI
jgi:hypothetical protein